MSLSEGNGERHLVEMAEVAQAVFVAVRARKMNYEALGNTVAHLHWWLTPRHHDDPHPLGPIWQDPEFSTPPWSRWHPAPGPRDELRRLLLGALHERDLVIERSCC